MKPQFLLVAAASVAVALGSTSAAAKDQEVEAGPIWNQMDADRKCPEVARKAGGTWTGQWRTTVPGRMSVCEVKGSKSGGGSKSKTVEVGPIWNQMDAQRKCPEAARSAGATWTGQWWTTQPGRMSVCEIKR